jgi:hypothetical protein
MPVRCCSAVAPVSRARHIAQVPSGSHVPLRQNRLVRESRRNPYLHHQGASDEIFTVAPAAGPATQIRSPPCTVVPQFVSRLWRHNPRGGQPDTICDLRALLHLCLCVERREAGGSVRIGATDRRRHHLSRRRTRTSPRPHRGTRSRTVARRLVWLPDQLIQAGLDHRAVAIAVHVEAVRRARSLPVESRTRKRTAFACGRRPMTR